MTSAMIINIALWLAMLLLIAFTKFDYGVIGLFISILLIVTGCISANDALLKWSDSNVIIMAAMMITVAGFSRTKAIKNISTILLKVSGGSFAKCMAMFMLLNAVIGIFMGAAVTRIGIVYPLIIALCRETNTSPSKAMFPIGCCLLCDQFSIPIGSAAVTFARYNGFLESAGYTFGDTFKMIDPFIGRIVPCVIMIIYWMTLGLKFAPEKPPIEIKGMNVREQKKDEDLTPAQDKAATIIFLATCVLLVIYDKIGVAQWVITMAGAIAMYAFGIIDLRRGINSVPWSILFLYVGAITMGTALQNTGTGLFVGQKIAGLLGDRPSTFVLYLTFWLVCMFLTQFMNNGATANMLIPIAILTANAIGCIAKGLILILQQASLVAWFMPTATAIIPMLMDGGGYDIKSLIKQGAPAALVSTLVSVLWIALMFPAYA